MTFKVPESVRSYYSDLDVQSGVDALLGKPQKLPPDLKWDELADYYGAWVAAHRVMVDHAATLAAAWTETWGSVVPSDWSPAAPDDQVAADTDADPHPSTIWANDWFVRLHSRNKSTLYTATTIDDSGLSIGFGVFNARGSAVMKSLEGFEFENLNQMLWFEEGANADSEGGMDLTALREAALRAMSALPTGD